MVTEKQNYENDGFVVSIKKDKNMAAALYAMAVVLAFCFWVCIIVVEFGYTLITGDILPYGDSVAFGLPSLFFIFVSYKLYASKTNDFTQ